MTDGGFPVGSSEFGVRGSFFVLGSWSRDDRKLRTNPELRTQNGSWLEALHARDLAPSPGFPLRVELLATLVGNADRVGAVGRVEVRAAVGRHVGGLLADDAVHDAAEILVPHVGARVVDHLDDLEL